MIDHEQRISATLRAVGDDVHTRPTLMADVRAGARRRRHRRRLGGVVAVTVAVAASTITVGELRSLVGSGDSVETPGASASASAPAGPAAPKECRIDRLPVPAGHPASIVTGGDPTGRYLVGRAYGSTGHVEKHRLLIWDNGRLTTVDMPGTDETFQDINGSGVAVGSSFDDGGGTSAYVYRDGKLTKLPAPATFVEVRAVGENGTIVGAVRDSDVGPHRPLVWRDPAGQPQQLDLPNGSASGVAVDVGADGTIVGSVSKTGLDDGQGYLWKPDGTGQMLPMPEINGKPANGWSPTSVHNGVIFGNAVVRSNTNPVLVNHPLLFDLRTGKFTILTHAYGGEGNTMGWLLVTANPLSVAAPTGRAILPPLASTGDRMIDRAAFISEDGRVIGGQSGDANGQMQAVRWTCT
jgi:hypothetical protein